MRWIVPFMGFRESDRWETGIERIWKDGLRPLARPDVCVVMPTDWDEDVRGFAQMIQRTSPVIPPPEIMVIAYSWGCGWAFIRFAKECQRLGLRIAVAVLCDPVYRSPWLPSWLPINPLSISPILRPVITIPASVERVEWVRQNVDLPSGHDVVARDETATRIGLGRYLKVGHTHIDDSPEFHELAIGWAKQFARGELA